MARIMYIGWNGWGHVNPTISLLNRLAKENEVFYLNSPDFFSAFKETNVITVKNRYMNLIYKFFRAESFQINKMSQEQFIYSVANFYEHIEYLYILLGEVSKCIFELKPDLIMHDSCAHVVKYLCKLVQIPRVSVSTLFAISKDMFLQDEALFENLYNFQMSGSIKEVMEQIDQIATQSSIKSKYFYDYFDGFTSKSELNLIHTSKMFQPFSSILDNSYKYIGNDISYRRSMEQSIQLKYWNKKILISLGSCLSGIIEYADFYCRLMNHFKSYDALFILVIGDMKIHNEQVIPYNFMIQNQIPQLNVLEQVDLFITHGGFNSVSESILNNVPMLVLPQIGDQYMNAKQIERYHVGQAIYDRNIDFFDLEQRISDLINDVKYRENIADIAKSYIDTGENEYAAQLIRDYIKNTYK